MAAIRAERRSRDRKAILTRQTRRIRALVGHIREHVPYYAARLRSLQIKADGVRGAADLDVLPLLVREDLQELAGLFVASNRSVRGCEIWGTSGTSGRPLQVLKPLRSQFFFYVRLQARLRQLGLRTTDFPPFGTNYVYVSDSEYVPERRRFSARMPIWRWSRIEKIDIRREFHESAIAPVEVISRFNPVVVQGKPSSLSHLASLMELADAARTMPIRPKVVLTGAEQLTPARRSDLESAFHCPVYDMYGTTEVGLIGCECQQLAGFHFEDDEVIVEVVRDGVRVPVGEVGEIVVTDLVNFTMPVVRYCTGDLGRVTYEPCSCGLAYPRLVDVQGRVVDLFVTASGELFNPFVLLGALPRIGLKQYQLVQTSPRHVLVRFIGDCPVSSVIAAVTAEVRATLGAEAEVTAERVDAIDVPGRKTRLYVNTTRKTASMPNRPDAPPG